MLDTAPLLRLDGVTKRYPGVTALDDLTVDVPRGRIGLVGANGAGKTTTFRLLLGLSRPSEGSVEVCGVDVAHDPIGVRSSAFTPCWVAKIDSTGYSEFSSWQPRQVSMPPAAYSPSDEDRIVGSPDAGPAPSHASAMPASRSALRDPSLRPDMLMLRSPGSVRSSAGVARNALPQASAAAKVPDTGAGVRSSR